MTTMQQETAQKLSMQQVRTVLKAQFEKVFDIEFAPISPADLDFIFENSTLKSRV
jgi:lipoate-protein ligase A